MFMLYYSSLLPRLKRPIIDPATVQLRNICTGIGNYARRLLFSASNCCTISDESKVLRRYSLAFTRSCQPPKAKIREKVD